MMLEIEKLIYIPLDYSPTGEPFLIGGKVNNSKSFSSIPNPTLPVF